MCTHENLADFLCILKKTILLYNGSMSNIGETR